MGRLGEAWVLVPFPPWNRTPGRFLCPKQGFFLVVVVFGFVGCFFFLTPCLCAKIPAAVELQANVVKANWCMCWRASLDDTGLLQSYLKRGFIFLFFMEPNWSKGKSDYSLTNSCLRLLASKRITIKKKRKIMTFLRPTGVLPTSHLPALVIHSRWNARWCFQKHTLL